MAHAETTLSRQISAVTGWALPPWSTGPEEPAAFLDAAVASGYDGVQVFLPDHAAAAVAAGLQASGIGPARTLADVEALLGLWAGSAAASLTLHLGTGFETPDEGRRLVDAALRAADAHEVAILIETHRATLTQDPARTLGLVQEFPELRFTADLSHWYTGVELVYGDLDAKLAALGPVFDRCRMIHGRISDPGCIQVAVVDDDPSDHVAHFRRMWRAVVEGCEAEHLPFVVELLPAAAHYARTVDRGDDGGPQEETDRWQQADVLWRIACEAARPG